LHSPVAVRHARPFPRIVELVFGYWQPVGIERVYRCRLWPITASPCTTSGVTDRSLSSSGVLRARDRPVTHGFVRAKQAPATEHARRFAARTLLHLSAGSTMAGLYDWLGAAKTRMR
jgi:hypothetical protein